MGEDETQSTRVSMLTNDFILDMARVIEVCDVLGSVALSLKESATALKLEMGSEAQDDGSP